MKKLIPDNEFVKNFLTLITGNVIAQLIPILASPFLTRIFSPADFGLLGLFMVITNSFSVVGAARYELAIMLPEKDEEAKNVFALSLFISICTGIIFGTLTIFFHDLIIEKLQRPDFSLVLYLAPVVILFISLYQALNYWLIRKKEFQKNAINKIGQTFSSTSGSIVLGLLGVPYGIVIGYALGWVAINLVGWIQLRTTGFKKDGITRGGMRKMFSVHRDFLTYNALPALMNSISTSLPLFFINLFYVSAIAGYFTLARQVLIVPISFISYAVSQVLFQRATEKIQQKLSIKKEFKNLFILLSCVAAFVFVVVASTGPWLFCLVFGSQWEAAGEYARILALSCSIQFLVSSFSILLPALGRVKTISAWQVVYFIFVCSLSFLSKKEIHSFLYAYLSIDVLMYSVYFVLILTALNRYERSIR